MTVSTWAPIARIISNITNANPGVVTTTQPHNYNTGAYVRIDMYPKPSLFGMTQVAGNVYLITVLSPTTFSIDVDTTSFDVFSISSTRQSPQVVPVGEIASSLASAEMNTLTPIGG